MPANLSTPAGLHGGKPPAKPLPQWTPKPVSGKASPGIGVAGNAKVAQTPHKLGLLASAEQAVGRAVSGALHAAYGTTAKGSKSSGALAAAQAPSIGGFGSLGQVGNREGQALGGAFYQDPAGTTLHTIGSLPGALNAAVMTPLHIAGTAISGHPLAAAKEIAGLPALAVAPYAGLGAPGGVQARTQAIEKGGALADLSLLAAGVGGGASAAGRAAGAAARATRFGKDEFAVTKAARERQTTALQTAHETAAKTGEPTPVPALSKTLQSRSARAKSLVYEAAATPRPPRRYGPDQTATPKVQPVGAPRAALVARERSPNLFVAAGQTAIDRARINAQQGRLHRVVDVAGRDHLTQAVPYASQLDMFTKPGEVVAKVRGGSTIGLPAKAKIGPTVDAALGGVLTRLDPTVRGQIHHVNAEQQDQIRLTQEENRAHDVIDKQIVKSLNPGQRDLLTFIKEGQIPAHDPVAGPAMLSELQRQLQTARAATDKRDAVTDPLSTRNQMSTRTLARVQKYIGEHGPGAVFNTDFERKAQLFRGETASAHRDPTLSPDTVMAKRVKEQTDLLDRWAKAHPQHPDAAATSATVAQFREQLQRGHDLRSQAVAGRVAAEHAVAAVQAKVDAMREGGSPASVAKAEHDLQVAHDHLAVMTATNGHPALHAQANDVFANAFNLQRQMALNHGLPTDLAYMPHVDSLKSDSKNYRAEARAPAAPKRNEGKLQEVGHTIRDPVLLSRARARNIANEGNLKLADHLDRSGIGPDNMTARQATEFMREHHMDPEHYSILSLGQFRRDVIARDHMANDNPHVDADPQAQAGALRTSFENAMHTDAHPAPASARGFKIYPAAMVRETQHGMTPAALRTLSRAKGKTSKYMLGLSPSWALTMWPAYMVQGAAGGALTPHSWVQAARWRKSLDPAQERTLRVATGIDSPVTSSHGQASVHGGSPPGMLADGLELYRGSPIGRMLAGKNPTDALMRFERIARVDSRYAVVYKGVRKEAIRQMVADSHGLMAAQNDVKVLTRRLSLAGRIPPEEFMARALANQPAMEKMVAHVHNALGDFHHMSRLERSYFNQIAMFYPWIRYSVKTAFHVLPAKHPLLASLGTYLGTLGEQDLTNLLGTAPKIGTVYLGPQQPNTPAASRQFDEVGLHSVNPLLNSVMETLDASNPSKAIGMLPPYVTTGLDWLFGVDSFTGQPLKDTTGVAYKQGTVPNLPQFALGQTASAFAPVRAINAAVTRGAPQAADSVPFLGMAHPQTSAKALAKPLTGSAASSALHALLPFLPKSAAELPGQIAYDQKQAGGGGLPSRAQLLGTAGGGLPSRAKLLGGRSAGLLSRAKLLGH